MNILEQNFHRLSNEIAQHLTEIRGYLEDDDLQRPEHDRRRVLEVMGRSLERLYATQNKIYAHTRTNFVLGPMKIIAIIVVGSAV